LKVDCYPIGSGAGSNGGGSGGGGATGGGAGYKTALSAGGGVWGGAQRGVARLDVGISGRDARLAILNVAVPGISRFRVRCFPIAPE